MLRLAPDFAAAQSGQRVPGLTSGNGVENKKQPATVSRGGLFQFDHRDEEYPSLAGLAATYSSKP